MELSPFRFTKHGDMIVIDEPRVADTPSRGSFWSDETGSARGLNGRLEWLPDHVDTDSMRFFALWLGSEWLKAEHRHRKLKLEDFRALGCLWKEVMVGEFDDWLYLYYKQMQSHENLSDKETVLVCLYWAVLSQSVDSAADHTVLLADFHSKAFGGKFENARQSIQDEWLRLTFRPHGAEKWESSERVRGIVGKMVDQVKLYEKPDATGCSILADALEDEGFADAAVLIALRENRLHMGQWPFQSHVYR